MRKHYQDTYKKRASRWQNGIRGGFNAIQNRKKWSYRDKYCLECGNVFTPNSPTQTRCGPFRDTESCAYKAMKSYWREREAKRRIGLLPQYPGYLDYRKKYGKKYYKTHKDYFREYGKKYRAKLITNPTLSH